MSILQYGLMGMLCLALQMPRHLQAQHDVRLKQALRPGDMLPAMPALENQNQPGQTIQLAGYKGKVLILDFFATWCGPCVASLPKLAALQIAMADSVQIVVVSYEAPATIAAFLKKRAAKTGQALPFPVIAGDTLLKALFPHRLLPHEVWIDRKGVFRGSTSPEEVSANSLRSFWHHGPVPAHQKIDILTNVAELAAQMDAGEWPVQQEIRLRFFELPKGAGSSSSRRKLASGWQWQMVNQPLYQLICLSTGSSPQQLQIPDSLVESYRQPVSLLLQADTARVQADLRFWLLKGLEQQYQFLPQWVNDTLYGYRINAEGIARAGANNKEAKTLAQWAAMFNRFSAVKPGGMYWEAGIADSNRYALPFRPDASLPVKQMLLQLETAGIKVQPFRRPARRLRLLPPTVAIANKISQP
ncbi:MAG TPA: TlpA disulfide reductase family protein [Phnomibacter sp.]|nr:TlpA disulfide reductase family protein [Phnomibacter sp.]